VRAYCLDVLRLVVPRQARSSSVQFSSTKPNLFCCVFTGSNSLLLTMKSFWLFLSLIIACASLQAAHPLLICDSGGNRVCVLSSEGKIEWATPYS